MLTRYWTLLAIGVVLLVGGLSAASVALRPDAVSVSTVYFRAEDGARMRAVLFRPPSATRETPAPGILAVHGYLNTAEMQSNFAVELARRGYVVLAPDQRGHGGSDPASFAAGFGGPGALSYLRSLPYVDPNNIGLEGHSMGGWAVLAAAKAHPGGYKAMVLEGSSVGAPFAPEGDARFPRNVLVVFAKYDEFGAFMWGSEAPFRTGATAKAIRLFGVDEPVVPGRVYGDIAAGDARMLEAPRMTHPWLHHSPIAIGAALEWFARTLQGGTALRADDQVWQRKEVATAAALVGTAPFLIGVFGLLWRLSPVGASATERRESHASDASAPVRLVALAALLLVPVASYVPLMKLSEALIGQNAVFRQTFSNQISLWLVCNGLVALPLGAAPGMPRLVRKRPAPGVLVALLIAVLCAGLLHVIISLADALGNVSPQAWFIIWRPLTLVRLQDFAVYLPGVLFFFIVVFRSIDRLRPLDVKGAWSAFAFAAGVTAGPFVLFLALQYGALFLRGALFFPEEGLRVIISILIPPLMILASALVVATTRLTGGTLPGAFLSALIATWFLTATQPIGVG